MGLPAVMEQPLYKSRTPDGETTKFYAAARRTVTSPNADKSYLMWPNVQKGETKP